MGKHPTNNTLLNHRRSIKVAMEPIANTLRHWHSDNTKVPKHPPSNSTLRHHNTKTLGKHSSNVLAPAMRNRAWLKGRLTGVMLMGVLQRSHLNDSGGSKTWENNGEV
jgi:hypothetical protein